MAKTVEVTNMNFVSPEGDRIQLKEIESGKFEWIAVGYSPVPNEAYAFETREHFVSWSKGKKFEAKVAHIFHTIDRAQQVEKADNTIAIERQRELTKRVSDELKKLSERTGLAMGSEELLLRASHQSYGVEGPVFDSALLCNLPKLNATQGILPIVSGWTYPDFRWLGFDKRASSGVVFGDVILCTGYWYQGMGVSMRSNAFPPFDYETLTFDLGGAWNNAISSALSLWW
jgi:hypothetical protein